MARIWEFFENLGEFVYVTDMDTYELVYMNKKALKQFGFVSAEELKGKKCYEVIQKCSSPCAICNNQQLSSGYFKEWQFFNPVVKKQFLIKDTMVEEDSHRYRIELAVDISAQEQQMSIIRGYHSIESMVNEGIRLALQASDPDKALEIILEYLGRALKGERTYIFEKNERGSDDNTYEWTAKGVTPEIDNLQELPPEVCANWYSSFSENKNIVINDLEEIRETDPLQYENLKRQDIHSIAVAPLYDEKRIIGFYGVDNPPQQRLEYAANMLQIMGHFIVSTLKRRDLLKELRRMSYSDQLTRLGNRHAMEEYISNIRCEESVGVVYCDITGLKQVNDSQGHHAGDDLISRAAESLKETFGEFGLFRIGGDELLALCLQIDENTLQERTDRLKEAMVRNSVNMAVGSVWIKDGADKCMDKLLSGAEKLMYEDKSRYYRTSGLDRRR
ncbi:MAG: diguanylate cyclase domain-containing protein [Oscillospiraceae bacterium]